MSSYNSFEHIHTFNASALYTAHFAMLAHFAMFEIKNIETSSMFRAGHGQHNSKLFSLLNFRNAQRNGNFLRSW